MDLAAAARPEPARLARVDYGPAMQLRKRTGATPCDGTDDYATAGSGPTRQSGARDSELPQAQVNVACASLLV